jgi:hypothetical protein
LTTESSTTNTSKGIRAALGIALSTTPRERCRRSFRPTRNRETAVRAVHAEASISAVAGECQRDDHDEDADTESGDQLREGTGHGPEYHSPAAATE